MNNFTTFVKTHKSQIIKGSLIVLGTVAAITIVGFVANHDQTPEILIDLDDDASLTIETAPAE